MTPSDEFYFLIFSDISVNVACLAKALAPVLRPALAGLRMMERRMRGINILKMIFYFPAEFVV
jgi:hypothetical protein